VPAERVRLLPQERDEARMRSDPNYEAPRIDRLGTLTELTQGGGVSGPDDGLGGAADGVAS